jgi:ABC-2 type transport system ATP-binding protein
LIFASAPPDREFRIAGVERIQTKGPQMVVFASRNSEAVVERARDLNAVSVEIAPVGLREIFLETVKAN